MTKQKRTLMMRFLDGVERIGNKLPHPFWLFCILIIGVSVISEILFLTSVSVDKPETQILRTIKDGNKIDGQYFTVESSFQNFIIDMEKSSHSSRLNNIYVEVYSGNNLVYEKKIGLSDIKKFQVSKETFSFLEEGNTYLIKFVNRSVKIKAQTLISKEGLNWFVLHMVENFSHFEPLGMVLVILMSVAIAEGAGLIPAVMRGVALSVPNWLIIPALFGLAACGNIGSDAGVVVIPPLAAAIFRQLGRNPIIGFLIGYVGATAGFTANILPAGTDVLAMALTNAATGNNPEINVLANWYFMIVSVVFLSIAGTLVTKWYVIPRFEDPAEVKSIEIEHLTSIEKKGIIYAVIGISIALGIWSLTIIPQNGLLRHPDPNPDLFWRSNFFKGLIPILFTLFTIGGIIYGKVTKTIKKADDIIGFMADAMKRMGGYIVLTLAISQFTEIFQFTKMDQLIAIEGANVLRAMGFENFPILFFVAFIIIIGIANIFLGSASAKWAIFAPIFVPMFMSLNYHPAFTQLLYRLGDSITNCVSPLYPYFPILLGWIADVDKEKAKVGTVLSYLIPYANFLLWGWVGMLIIWYLLGLDIGPNSPIFLNP